MSQAPGRLRWNWSTAPGAAAIAVMRCDRIEGLLDRCPSGAGRARLAGLHDAQGTLIDEVIAVDLGDGMLEIMVHGGGGVRQAVEAALLSHGAVSDLSLGPDGTWQALARSASPAAVAWRLRHGAAAPPFPGEYLDRSPIILITGPANAGKSTLLNAWCGHHRALVDEVPGTTRDLVEATTMVCGWRLRLIDSAGMRPAADGIEAAGQALVGEARAWADVVIHLTGPDIGFDPAHGRPTDLRVRGKADLGWPAGVEADAPAWSARPGPGSGDLIDGLGRQVLGRLGLPTDLLQPGRTSPPFDQGETRTPGA